MSTFSDIKSLIRTWFVSASGLADDRVIWKEQSGPIPDKPYAALRTPKNLLRYGTSDSRQMPLAGATADSEIVNGQRKFIINTEIYGLDSDLGDSPMDSMIAVQNSLQKSSTIWELKREHETVISVNAGVTPAESYQIDIDNEEIEVVSEAFLSLTGAGYAQGAATGIFNTAYSVYKTRFKPGFALNDGGTRRIFDTSTGTRYGISKSNANALEIRAGVGDPIVFSVTFANLVGDWVALGWNELVVTVDSLGVNHSAVLNDVSLTITGAAAFTPGAPALISVGARLGLNPWNGLIDYVRIYAGATEALALANLTAGYEFANDYTGTPAPTLVEAGSGNSFVTEDTPTTIRDAFVIAINASPYLDTGIVASAGTEVDEVDIVGSVGQDVLVEIATPLNLTLVSTQGAVDLAIIEDLGIVDVTAFLTTEWEPRVQMDIAFGTHSRVFDAVGSIETVEITDLDDGDTFTVGD